MIPRAPLMNMCQTAARISAGVGGPQPVHRVRDLNEPPLRAAHAVSCVEHPLSFHRPAVAPRFPDCGSPVWNGSVCQ